MGSFNQSNSQVEFERLRQLQEGINRQRLEKQYTEQEKRNIQIASDRFKEQLKSSGRAQPLRQNDTRITKAKKRVSKINAVTNVISQINWNEDGLYFVVFIVSVIGDIGTMLFGAVEAIPGAGWVLGTVFGIATRTFVFGISAVIFMLYLMNGHYKKRKVLLKVATLMGFSMLELMPIVTALPGFIGSFIINYGIVLYGRAMEGVIGRRIAPRNVKELVKEEVRDRLKRRNLQNRVTGLSE